jgi:hypothetical protein
MAAHSVIAGRQGVRDWLFCKNGTTSPIRNEGRLTIRTFECALVAAGQLS